MKLELSCVPPMKFIAGYRNMLARILKGSKDKKILEFGLDQCPTYGYITAG